MSLVRYFPSGLGRRAGPPRSVERSQPQAGEHRESRGVAGARGPSRGSLLGWLLGRRRADGERGQAMPMAAVGIFAMTLGVLATLNLGQAVHQKIKLQNTADSAAYTLAAMEARTFNYIAFLNRVQIAHYNTAMVVQSYLTWVGFQVSMFGAAADLTQTVANAVQTGASWGCPYAGCPYLYVQTVITVMAQLAQAMKKIAVNLYQIGAKLGHQIVEAMSIFNTSAVWQAQAARALLLNVHIATGMQNYIEKLDPDISYGSGKMAILNSVVNGVMNSIEYYQTFDHASGMNPYMLAAPIDYVKRVRKGGTYSDVSKLDDKAKDAYRVMTELCHATRTPQFVSNRSGSAFAISIPSTITGSKMGQTKITEEADSLKKPEIPQIRSEKNYRVGKNLASDDYLQSGFGFGMMVGYAQWTPSGAKLGDAVRAYEDKGEHYRYKKDTGTSGTIVPGGTSGGVAFAFPPPQGTTSNNMETEDGDGHAKWPGYAPYFKFKPNKERTSDYNQPSTWIFLNKHHKDFQTDGGSHGGGGASKRAPWYGKFTWRNGNQVASLDTTIGGSRNSYFLEGLSVLARGQAYYHRPDASVNWKEHPNFFNPFWRARLAPVGQKLQNFWDKYVTSKITTSSDNQAIKAAVNLLRNAQMDLFTAVITGLITH